MRSISLFDGKNILLNYFIERCKEIKFMSPNEAKSQFAKIIRTRVVGEACRTIEQRF